jgi:Radical SAM superfamily
MRDYSYNGLAGCVVQCMSLPGVPVGLYSAEQAQFDTRGGPWVTVCEAHGTLANHRTLELAQGHLFLVDWCESCQQSLSGQESEQTSGARLKARWSEDGASILLFRGSSRPPIRVEPARTHDPLILQSASSFVQAFDYTLAPYENCQYACTYCYVPTILHGLPDKLGGWGNYVKPRFRCVESLLKHVGDLSGARLFLSATTDPYQRVEQLYRLTRSLLEQLVDIPFTYLLISTRGGLVLRDLDLFKRMADRVEIGISISSDLAERVHDTLEPDTPSYAGRFKVARVLHDNGIATRIHAAPLGAHSEAFLERAACCAHWLWVDGAGHGARRQEPARSLLYDYARAQDFAERAKAQLGEGRVGFGSAHFGHRWDGVGGRIVAVPPTETLRKRRKLVCAASS